MGFFDGDFLPGGLFDFNGDGKTSWDEAFLGYKIFEECTKEQEDELDDDYGFGLFDDTDDSDKYDWRLFCEDGFEFGVDPEDYETEEEYEEALNEAKYGWRDDCEDGSEYGIFPENHETEDEYEEALNEAKYGWRDDCEDGSEYRFFPENYETEEEYEEMLQEIKYGWRKTCRNHESYGLDPDSFETQDEYLRGRDKKWREARKQELNKFIDERRHAEQAKRREYKNDKTVYTYCGVLLPFSSRPYSFRTEEGTIKLGDKVVVPVGEDDKEMTGTVVSIGQYLRLGAPYPLERTKFILRKADNAE